MLWDGTRWINEANPKPQTNPRAERRRRRAVTSLAIVATALVALVIPVVSASASTPIGRLIDQWNNAAVVKTYSESSSFIAYTGSWPRRYHRDYRGDYARSAAVRGASATFRFKGSAVAWAGAVGPDRGRAAVYVDGVLKTTVDLHATSFRAQNILYQRTFPGSVNHTIKIVVLGTANHPRVTVDGFIVRGALPTTPSAVPPGTRPFAAPVTTRTVSVPSSIDSSGATNAQAALQTFINSQPDGTVINFKAGGVYRMNRGLNINGHHRLVLSGNGATLRAAGSNTLNAASPIVLEGSNSDIVVRGFTIEGNNPHTGTDIYDSAAEGQQGIAMYGGTRIEITGNTIRRTWGDAVYANEKLTTHAWVDGLWVHANTITTIGRNAFTMNGAKNALLERNSIDQIGGTVMNIEPDLSTQGAINVTLRSNTVGVWGMTPVFTQHFVACANNKVAPGAVISGITVTGNVVTKGAPNSVNTNNAGGLSTWIGKDRTSNITFTNNSTTKAARGPVLYFEHVDGLTVSGNVQPLTSGSLASVSDSTNVTLK
jgi:hypothetical protein